MTEIGTFIHAQTEDTTPATDDEVLTYDITASAVKRVKLSNVTASGGISSNGWITANAMSFGAADDPTYTMTCAGDQTTIYQPGQRIKLTQSTGGIKYFIITKVVFTSVTTLTLYGGTDYNLENEAITNPYYSPIKAPFGFPLDPTKWTAEITDTTERAQTNPGNGTWYNLGSMAITIPIGIWKVSYKVGLHGYTNGAGMTAYSTLSTANNSVDLTCYEYSDAGTSTVFQIVTTVFTEKYLNLASKTIYYLNAKTATGSALGIYFRNNLVKMIIRAVCAYL
jgi:hypothetical protein